MNILFLTRYDPKEINNRSGTLSHDVELLMRIFVEISLVITLIFLRKDEKKNRPYCLDKGMYTNFIRFVYV